MICKMSFGTLKKLRLMVSTDQGSCHPFFLLSNLIDSTTVRVKAFPHSKSLMLITGYVTLCGSTKKGFGSP